MAETARTESSGHWVATAPTHPAAKTPVVVTDADEAERLRDMGWTVEGPFVLAATAGDDSADRPCSVCGGKTRTEGATVADSQVPSLHVIKITVEGDTAEVDAALRAAQEAVEKATSKPVYRAWSEILR